MAVGDTLINDSFGCIM